MEEPEDRRGRDFIFDPSSSAVSSNTTAVSINTSATTIAPVDANKASSSPVRLTIGKRIAEDLARLGQAINYSDGSDQRHKKDVATLALNTVFAEYGL